MELNQRNRFAPVSFKTKWLFLVLVAVLGFLADWYTKYLVERSLQIGRPIAIIGNYLQIVLVYNKGMLFGFDPRSIIPGFPLHLFFFVFSSMAIIVLLIYYHNIKFEDVLMRWGVALILPGAMGNLFDRIIRPEKGVVDFIKMGISENLYWPIYNMADIYVTFGVAIILFCFIRDELRGNNATQTIEAPIPAASND